MSLDTDRFYDVLEKAVNERRVAAGQAPLVRVRLAELEREAAERAVEARQQVGLDLHEDPEDDKIQHPGETIQLERLGWPTGNPPPTRVTELATWNFLWNDPTQAAVDTRTSDGALFGLINTEPHHTLLMNPAYTHWGVGIHREFKPGETNPLLERWYFIIWLSTPSPLPSGPYAGFGSTYGYPRTVRFTGKVTGRQFSQDGKIVGTKAFTWSTSSSATAGRRALIPGQPGVWLYIVNGAYAGYWVPEGTVAAGNT